MTRVDAIVPGAALTLGLARSSSGSRRSVSAIPSVTLLVPAARPSQPGVVGEGKHLRFRVRQRGRDAGTAIAFGLGSPARPASRAAGRYDVAFRLKENRWNGTVAPQLVVRRVFDAPDGYEELRGRSRRAVEGRRGRLDRRGAARSSPSSRSTRVRGASSTSRRRSERCSPEPSAPTSCRAPPSDARSDLRRLVPGRTRRVVQRLEQARELAGLALAAAV